MDHCKFLLRGMQLLYFVYVTRKPDIYHKSSNHNKENHTYVGVLLFLAVFTCIRKIFFYFFYMILCLRNGMKVTWLDFFGILVSKKKLGVKSKNRD